MLVQFFHHINKFGFRILMRIVGKQSIDIRKKEQKIGTYHSGNHCGQGIVITKLNLVSGYGIIFIYDGDRTHA